MHTHPCTIKKRLHLPNSTTIEVYHTKQTKTIEEREVPTYKALLQLGKGMPATVHAVSADRIVLHPLMLWLRSGGRFQSTEASTKRLFEADQPCSSLVAVLLCVHAVLHRQALQLQASVCCQVAQQVAEHTHSKRATACCKLCQANSSSGNPGKETHSDATDALSQLPANNRSMQRDASVEVSEQAYVL